MTFHAFVEGPLLWVVFLGFLIGMGSRLFLFFWGLVKGDPPGKQRAGSTWALLGRALLPFHLATIKKPFYAALLYVFHGSLIVVPIWYSGHIVLWEESRLEWSWPAIPDAWADGLTLLVLGIFVFFIVRRLILRKIRHAATWPDVLIILLTALPFLTGYLQAHGRLDHVPFFSEHLATIHILSGEAMILMIIFLTIRTTINALLCTGCAACGINCLTGALKAGDEDNLRTFSYAPSQCVTCGECLVTCPEGAVILRHGLDLNVLGQNAPLKDIGSADLKLCENCNTPVAPINQIEKITDQLEEVPVLLCSQCKEDELTREFYQGEVS